MVSCDFILLIIRHPFEWNLLNPFLLLFYLFFFYSFQIRQEKPYYIADPEVDSLVSISINKKRF